MSWSKEKLLKVKARQTTKKQKYVIRYWIENDYIGTLKEDIG
jgi:hypothetical protein